MPLVLLGSITLVAGVWAGRVAPELSVAAVLAGLLGSFLLWRGLARLPGFLAAIGAGGVLLGAPGPARQLPPWAAGEIVEAPRASGAETRLVLESTSGARIRAIVGGQIRGDLTVGDRVGARVPVRGLRAFENPDLPGARGPPSLSGNAIVADPRALVVAGGPRRRPLRRAIERARSRVRDVFARGLREPARGVMRALVLGEGYALDPGAARAYRDTGTIHVLAVSGLHVVLVAAALQALVLAGLRRVAWLARRTDVQRAAAWTTLPAVAAYTVFAGAGPSAVRAAVMAAAVLLARALGRASLGSAALAIAGAVQLALWPEDLDDPGLQLSYVAVLGLFALAPPVQGWLRAVLVGDPERTGPWRSPPSGTSMRPWLGRSVAALVAANVAATVVTAPVLALHFGQVAPASLVANLFAVPISSVVLLPLGLGLAMLSLVAPSWAEALCALAQPPCDALTSALALIARLPLAQMTVTPPGGLATFAMVVLLLSLAWGRRWTRGLRVVLVAAIAVGPPIRSGCVEAADPRVRLTVLDVGQGDASVLELPGGKAVVVDAGGLPGSRIDPGARVVVPYLRRRGVREIAALIVSHPHPDHYGGVPAVAEAMPVARVWQNGQAGVGAFGAILAGLRARGVPERGPDSLCGRPAAFGPVVLEVLEPCPGPAPDAAPNDASLVVRVTHGRVRMLLLGDIEEEGERALLEGAADLAADLVKVPHHGSRTSSGSDLVAAIRPRWAVVSVGAWNRFRHPADAALARWRSAGAQVLRTDVHGGVRLVSDGVRLELETTGRDGPR
jgi:competence protein ComEC